MAAAAAVSKVCSSLDEAIQAKDKMTHGPGNESVKTKDICTMKEIPDFLLSGKRRTGAHKFNRAVSMIFRGGGLYGDKKEGVGFIVYGSFEDNLQY